MIRFGGLGDILLATPTLRALHQAFPGIEIDFIVGDGMTDAIAGHPCVRRVMTFKKLGGDSRVKRMAPFLFDLSRQRYDLVVNLHPSVKSILMTLAAAPRRAVLFRKNVQVSVVTGRVPHAIDDFSKELAAIGIGPVSDRAMDFFIPNEAYRRVDSLLADEGVSDLHKLLVMNPAASRPINRWSAERFQAVAQHFASLPDVRVVVTGAPPSFQTVVDDLDEFHLAAKIASGDPRIINLAGRTTIKEFGAVLLKSSAFLTCDTGPMHIGAALGVPMAVLYGSVDPDRTGPLGAAAEALRDSGLACVPCRSKTCARGDMLCMTNLTTATVIERLTLKMGLHERGKHVLALSLQS